MPLVELSLELTAEQKAMRDTARKLGVEVVRPAAIALDKLDDPAQVIAPESALWEVLRRFRRVGLHRASYPAAFGGLELDALTIALISEEMGYAAADLAVSLGVSAFPFNFALLSPYPEIQDLTRQYCEDIDGKMIGCWAITEPDHGSDWILYDTPQAKDPGSAPSVRAVKDGDHYVINGQKSAWVSNGTIATHAALFLSLDPSSGMQGGGVAVVPLDLPGVRRGKPLNKMGQRALNQGEIFFDGVRIPESMLVIGDPDIFRGVADITLATANGAMGACFVGLAQAAFDEALSYAQERVQGGRPIFGHQNIQLRLFDMFVSVEAARSLSRRVLVYNSRSMPPAVHYAIASKVLATETAFRVASQAMQVFGGYGLCKDYLIEKLFRDARAAMIEDGTNDALSIAGAGRLV